MAMVAAYLIFIVAAALCFVLMPVRRALLAVFLGGWLLLPVGHYPPSAPIGRLTWWVTGVAVPSDMLVTKAWISALVTLLGGLVRDFATVRRWRPAPIDAGMAAWCVWPLVDGLTVATPSPSPWIASLYVSGVWGLPWLIGRIWFGGRTNGRALLRGLAVAGVACLPIALMEGGQRAFLYDAIYGNHPFQADGVARYLGFRPLGFFEHGNQYGIWVALCALAALWTAAARRDRSDVTTWRIVGGVAAAIALASQSVGAILLLLIGLAILACWRLRFIKPAVVALAILIVAAGAVHLSGVVPLQTIARQTSAGQRTLAFFRAAGRQSFLWRFSQDTRTLPAMKAAPLRGAANWGWFAPFNTRPWGLAMLIIGQYGLIGFGLLFGTLAAAALGAMLRLRVASVWARDAAALPLALIVMLALADAILNSFFFFPAVLAAGAIAVRPPSQNRWRPA
ncbi:hypothetical protein [Sphingomonas nostoxanthinifaciens]|uniref:hypothetical protein n=1 Tax=Sphingomonas nostoxanthinifaciens TaxID=2872652 RepID=UPI001CC21CA9|nr:hypothetical protein [Sphingomonas nostoxanthinifaciens]UAK25110.1 hypothetical protein K8P63_02565 [Sphingomonas nostoxanthinifaciens]